MEQSYPRQKRVAGHANENYRWADRRPASARPIRRESVREDAEASGAQAVKEQYTLLLNRALMYLLIVCIVFVSFMQLGKITQITAQEKENASVAAATKSLDQEAQNIESVIANNMRSAAIVEEAKQRLHMQLPTENQTANLVLEPRYTAENVQTAEGIARSR